ncbi:MAG: hypothetical protein SGPRY_009381 [Prymnesium sp.]
MGARSVDAGTWSRGDAEDDDASPVSTADSSVLLYTRTETLLKDRHLYFFTLSYPADFPTSARSLQLNAPQERTTSVIYYMLVLHRGQEGGSIPGALDLLQQLCLEGLQEDAALLAVDIKSGLTTLSARF